ncbi:MAG TPA: histidine kinase [Puia sp.]|nr:histidine kinase [Puia sp.]
MRAAFFLVIFPFLWVPYPARCQEYSYTHYDIADGLAGSTVYCIAQDRDGFIWASTETGVSRFDGTHFKNFTIADGLPDIEVLQLFGDREGRLWMAPFRKSVCYWYRGRIHNQENDSMLRKIDLRQNIENFVEDSDGNILIQENSALHLVLRNGTVKEFDSLDQVPVLASVAACLDASGHFLVQVGGRVFRITDTVTTLVRLPPFKAFHPNLIAMSSSYLIWRMTPPLYSILSLATGHLVRRTFHQDMYRHISFTLLQDSLVYVNEILGCTENNIRSGKVRRFLSDKPVSRVFRDMDGNLWFATLGQGIYRLNSDQFGIRKIPTLHAETSPVMAILRVGNRLWVGNDRQQLFRLSLPGLRTDPADGGQPIAKNRILYLDTVNGDKIVSGSDNNLIELRGPGFRPPIRVVNVAVKSISRRPDGRLLVASVWGVGVFDVRQWRFIDTIWRERATTVLSYRDTVYIGTLNGLYRLAGNDRPMFMGASEPLLRTRISAIARGTRGIYWVATYGAGIIGLRGDSVITVINKKHGLTSDICRCLLLHGQTLWEGTDRGLNRIELDKPGFPVTAFTSKDGLGSDIINAVYADSSMTYIGTPAGLSYFDPRRPGLKEGCRLYLLSLINHGTDRVADTANLVIPYKDRSVRFEYAGISYRSGGDITYRYRMIGLDSSWRTTKLTDLEYPVMPPGKYEFQLAATNKFGVTSGLLTQRFTVVTPFWLSTWFDMLVVIMFALCTWGLTSWRIRTFRRQQQEKDQLARKMMELERVALQAQMNPHFIFNCLTSVQQYIVDRDVLSANKYITGLARLIRLTLHNSSLAFIRLTDEIDYLSAYMALEKLRFKEKMGYSIDVDPKIQQGSCLIPPMLIQPYVENSIRHGLRHRTGGRGYIWLRIRQDLSAERMGLTITIEDNGIGRARSARYKTAEHIEYQSKGMTMTADRIRIINAAYGGDIRVEVIDLEDAAGQAAGTRVIMQFTSFDHLQPNQKETL